MGSRYKWGLLWAAWSLPEWDPTHIARCERAFCSSGTLSGWYLTKLDSPSTTTTMPFIGIQQSMGLVINGMRDAGARKRLSGCGYKPVVPRSLLFGPRMYYIGTWTHWVIWNMTRIPNRLSTFILRMILAASNLEDRIHVRWIPMTAPFLEEAVYQPRCGRRGASPRPPCGESSPSSQTAPSP